MPRHAGGRARTSRRARATALAGVAAACALTLPLAVACAGQDEGRNHPSAGPDDLRPISVPERGATEFRAEEAGASDGRVPGRDAPGRGAPEIRVPEDGDVLVRVPTGDEAPPGAHVSTALRCGPALSSPDGVEAQTCVAVRGEDAWARTYYRNITGAHLEAALSLLGPDGLSVRSRCVAGEGDDPSLCETPRVRLKGEPLRYAAIAEFAAHGGGAREGRLLLRAGSNSPSGRDR
ncbi:hypothetical protein ACH46L_07665 [Streptomyces althioticus]|uniref:hypothetical protein n=1 Tax=Streptomyces althioticus TaxID=83380 RepID=UPI0037AAFD21